MNYKILWLASQASCHTCRKVHQTSNVLSPLVHNIAGYRQVTTRPCKGNAVDKNTIQTVLQISQLCNNSDNNCSNKITIDIELTLQYKKIFNAVSNLVNNKNKII